MANEIADGAPNMDETLESRRQFMRTRLGGILFGAVALGAAETALAELCHCNVPHADCVSGHSDNQGHDIEDAPHSGAGHSDYTMHTNDAHVDYATSHSNTAVVHHNHTNSGYTTTHVNIGHQNYTDCKTHTDNPHQDSPGHVNHTNSHSDNSTHKNACGTNPQCRDY